LFVIELKLGKVNVEKIEQITEHTWRLSEIAVGLRRNILKKWIEYTPQSTALVCCGTWFIEKTQYQ